MKKSISSVFSLLLVLSLMLTCLPIVHAAEATIKLNGSSASVTGSGAAVSGNVITITEEGTYNVSGTLNNGRILVDAKGCDITLNLGGVNINCNYGSPIYVFKAASVTLNLKEGTENILTDGESYTFEDNYSSASEQEPNACLYSKGDLIIAGTGKLKVTGNFNNGITSKDTLTVRGAEIEVYAKGNGINGKDSFFAANATFNVTASGGDALRSTQENDPSLGWITLNNCTSTLVSANDGIQSETGIIISGGKHNITCGGGHTEALPELESAKGIKAGTTLSLNAESVTVSSSDDAIHAGGDITVEQGNYALSSGDDAIHSDASITVNGGKIQIYSLGKGIDGTLGATQNGGLITVSAYDSSIFNTIGGFTFVGGRFIGISDRDTVIKPSDNSSPSFAVAYDTAIDGTLKVWDISWDVPFAVKYILVATNSDDKTVIDFGGEKIEAALDNGFTLYNSFNSSYAVDNVNMLLLGVKAETPASALGMDVYRKGVILDSTKIVATGDTVTVDGKEYSVLIIGDVSRDGKINSTDFMQVRKQYLGLYEMDSLQKLAADVNGDNKINSTDFMQIRKHFLGLFDLFN